MFMDYYCDAFVVRCLLLLLPSTRPALYLIIPYRSGRQRNPSLFYLDPGRNLAHLTGASVQNNCL